MCIKPAEVLMDHENCVGGGFASTSHDISDLLSNLIGDTSSLVLRHVGESKDKVCFYYH